MCKKKDEAIAINFKEKIELKQREAENEAKELIKKRDLINAVKIINEYYLSLPFSISPSRPEIGIDPSEVLENMLILKGRAQVDMSEIVGITPIYVRT